MQEQRLPNTEPQPGDETPRGNDVPQTNKVPTHIHLFFIKMNFFTFSLKKSHFKYY